jgi:hypothetical protein
LFDPLDHRLFVAAFAGQFDHVSQKLGHLGFVAFGQFINFVEVKLSHCLLLLYKLYDRFLVKPRSGLV